MSRTRVAFVTEILAEYKLHLHARLAAMPELDVVVWHGPHRRGELPVDVTPGPEVPGRSARNLHLRLPGLPITLVWQRLHRDLWSFDPKVIVLEDGVRILSHWPLVREARRRGVPVVLYTHGENRRRAITRGLVSGGLAERVRDLLHRQAAALVLYSDRSAREYRRRHPGRPCYVATNTLDVDAIAAQLAALPPDHRASERARLGVPDDRLLLVGVGRMVSDHDPRPLLRAVLEARRRGARCHLALVGGGPLEAEVRERVLSLPPGERAAIHLCSRLDLAGTTRVMAACDALAVIGAVGLAVVHAFAVGLPVIAVDDPRGNSPEIDYVEPESNGLVVRQGDHEALVRAILRMEREPVWRRRMARGASRYVRDHLRSDLQARGFADAVRHVTGGGPAPASGAAPAEALDDVAG